MNFFVGLLDLPAGSGISRKYFCHGGVVPSEWTRSIRAFKDSSVADYSALGLNTTGRIAYRSPIAVSAFHLALWVSHCKLTH